MARITPIPQASAFRLLVQGDDDADPVEFCIAAASKWTTPSRPQILAINATGRTLDAYSRRYPSLVQITDDNGRPSRSLSEIGEVLADLPPTIGVVVMLDAGNLYRAARCAQRSADDVKGLSAGHWDLINEALGRGPELVSRAGVPLIVLAPTTDDYGASEDGEQIKVGTKAGAWKGLFRSSHAAVHLTREGMATSVEVLADDHRVLGVPGSVREGMDGAGLGLAFEAIARASAPTSATTLLEETTTAELAARDRVARQRVTRSLDLRMRANMKEPLLRAVQGEAAWLALMGDVGSGVLTPEDYPSVEQAIAAQDVQLALWWNRAVTLATASGRPVRTLSSGVPGKDVEVQGPSPSRCPKLDGGYPVEWLLSKDELAREADIVEAPPEALVEWCAALAQYAGAWTEGGLAAVSHLAGVPARGPEWSAYSADELRWLAMKLAALAMLRRMFGPGPVEPTRHPEVSPKPVARVADDPFYCPAVVCGSTEDRDDAEDRVLHLIGASEPEPDREPDPPTMLRVVDLGRAPAEPPRRTSSPFPTGQQFECLPQPQQLTALKFLLDRCGAWSRIDEIVETVGAETDPKHKVCDVRHWPDPTKVAVYRHLLALYDAQDFWRREAS